MLSQVLFLSRLEIYSISTRVAKQFLQVFNSVAPLEPENFALQCLML